MGKQKQGTPHTGAVADCSFGKADQPLQKVSHIRGFGRRPKTTKPADSAVRPAISLQILVRGMLFPSCLGVWPHGALQGRTGRYPPNFRISSHLVNRRKAAVHGAAGLKTNDSSLPPPLRSASNDPPFHSGVTVIIAGKGADCQSEERGT